MSVNKFQDGELVKVSGGLTNSSNISFKDNINNIEVNNVKEALDALNTIKVDKENVLSSLSEVIASTNNQDIAGAGAIKQLNNYSAQINTLFSSMIQIKQFNTGNFSISANGSATIQNNVALSGYTPLGIIGWANGALSQFYPSAMYISGNTAYFVMQSTYPVDFPNAVLHYWVLYVRNGMI